MPEGLFRAGNFELRELVLIGSSKKKLICLLHDQSHVV